MANIGTNPFAKNVGVTGEYIGLTNPSHEPLLVFSTGSTVPSTGTYSKGCIYVLGGVATGTRAVYENLGDNATPIFHKVGGTTTGATVGTIATTSTTSGYAVVPVTGTISSITFTSVGALAASDTNYITFSATELGAAGAGSTALLAATAVNTTKTTGGTALTAKGSRSLTLTGTTANLAVTAGDVIQFDCAVTGTLGGTVAGAQVIIRIN